MRTSVRTNAQSPDASAADLTKRRQLDEAFNAKLQQLAKRYADQPQVANVLRQQIVYHDPSRIYLYGIPTTIHEEDAATTLEDHAIQTGDAQADALLQELRQRFAEYLFRLAEQALERGDAAAAYRLLHEVTHHHPQHPAAKILGERSVSEVAFQVQDQRRPHPKFGWPGQSYVQIRTDHFQILTNADLEAAKRLALHLEQLQAAWRQLFFDYWSHPAALKNAWKGSGLTDRQRRRFNVALFADRAEYVNYLQQMEPQASITLGYYHGVSRQAFFYVGEANESTWLHEATHQLFQETQRVRLPVGANANFWALEAVAMYMESLQPCGSAWSVGGLEAERLQIARYRRLVDQQFVPLATLSTWGQRQLQQDPNIQRIYSQAGGVAHFLMQGEQGKYRDAFLRLIREVYDRQDKPGSLAALAEVSFETLDQQYQTFCNIGDHDLQQLDNRIAPQQLVLRSTNVTDEGMSAVARWDQLRWLDLTDTAVTDKGLAGLDSATVLQQLTLERTDVTDRTAQRISRLTALRQLDLSSTKITDVGAASLSGLTHLESLWLTSTAITDEAADSLQKLRSLRQLDIQNTRVSALRSQQLQQSLPELRQASDP
ncbi:MAG: hypothetical protein R3C28_15200 [Pirellulaceae bacterium]